MDTSSTPPTDPPTTPALRDRLGAAMQRPAVRWATIGVAAVVGVHVVAAIVLFGLQRSHSDAVLAGVEVDGVPVGGLDRAGLDQQVDDRGDERLSETVRVTVDTTHDDAPELETDRAAVGLVTAIDATADDAWAQGRRGLWRALADQLRVRTGTTLDVPLQLDVRDDHLDDWADEAAADLSREPRSAEVTFLAVDPDDAEVERSDAVGGVDVDAAALADGARGRVEQLGPLHLEVPGEDVTPEVTDEDADAVIDDAELAISDDVELINPSPADDLVLTPTDLADVLHVVADPDAAEGERLQVTTDATRVGDHLGELVDELGPGSVDATMELSDGEVTIDGGTEGFELDLDATAATIVELSLRADDRSDELPGDTSTPDITLEAAEALLPDAELLISAPVALTNPSDGADLELTPEDLAVVLDVAIEVEGAEGDDDGDDGETDEAGEVRLAVSSSGSALTDLLGDDGVDALETGAVDLEVALVDGELDVSGGLPGYAWDADAAADTVAELAQQDEDRSGELPGDTTSPDRTREELEDAGVTEIVSSFTTDLVPGEPRNTNIHLAADHIDGDIIEPGATYSLNEGIGQRSADRGFVENGYIDDGELISVTGGGVSQMGTTFVNAAWFAGIALLDFTPHSLYFQRYPMGREATLSWGTLDVVVENDSPHEIMVLTSHTDSSVTVAFASTSWAEVDTWTGEPTDVEEAEERDGFTIRFGRDITYPDGTTTSESYTHRYLPDDGDDDD